MKYADMSIDELDQANAAMKAEVNKINAERNVLRAERDIKVAAEHQARADAAGKTGVKVTPDTAKIVKGN